MSEWLLKTITKTDVSTLIIVDERTHDILLQKKDVGYKWFPGKWCFFGGKIEPDDERIYNMNNNYDGYYSTEEIALIREIKEELELDLMHYDFNFFEKFDYEDTLKTEKRIGTSHVFYLFTDKTKLNLTLKEGAGLAFFNKKELKNVDMSKYTRQILNKFIKDMKI